jgi:hypothetical protein
MRTLGLLLVAVAGGCFAAEEITDELAGETDADSENGKADAGGEWDYYRVVRGATGFVLTRVNRTTTPCGDDSEATSCAADRLDLVRIAGMTTEAQTAVEMTIPMAADTDHTPILLKSGQFERATDGKVVFVAGEVWSSSRAGAVGQALFVKMKDSTVTGEKYREYKLNSARIAAAGAIDLAPTMAAPADITAALAQTAAAAPGLIIAGDRYEATVDGRLVPGRRAIDFYTRTAPR